MQFLGNTINNCLPGKLVPKATKEIATTLSARPTVQPKCEAKSPVIAVSIPIIIMATEKHAQPPCISVGGTNANRIFQKRVM